MAAAEVAEVLGKVAAGALGHPADWLRARAKQEGVELDSAEFAASVDRYFAVHPSSQRGAFHIPQMGNFEKTDRSLVNPTDEAMYLCGHSLGLQPKRTRELVNEELDKWAKVGVEGHWTGDRPWAPIDEFVVAKSAQVVGAKPSEVAIMNGLTVNLHLLFVPFYKPSGKRIKIMYESDAFPSDYHAFLSQAHAHGLDPKEALLPLAPRAGEELLRVEDVIKAIEDAGDSLAIVIIPTIQYFTGQLFDVPALVKAAQKVGAATIAQCAHGAGNVNMKLHDWDVDGAVWCSYKYLNSGPGSIAGFFIHERHHSRLAELPKYAGWWGHDKATRFDMAHVFEPMAGAACFQLSNPPVLQTVSLLASLDLFTASPMDEIRGRSMILTAYLELMMKLRLDGARVSSHIMTPTEPEKRGSMLNLKFDGEAQCVAIADELAKRGVVIDYRKPNVLRIAPAPLYNNFSDVFRFGRALKAAIEAAGSTRKRSREPSDGCDA